LAIAQFKGTRIGRMKRASTVQEFLLILPKVSFFIAGIFLVYIRKREVAVIITRLRGSLKWNIIRYNEILKNCLLPFHYFISLRKFRSDPAGFRPEGGGRMVLQAGLNSPTKYG